MENLTNGVICADNSGLLLIIGAYFASWIMGKFVDMVVYRNKSTLTTKEQEILINLQNNHILIEKAQDKIIERLEEMQRTEVIISTILQELIRKK